MSEDSVIANDIERFDADVQTFSTAVQSLRKDYDALEQNVGALSDMWTGEAHDALWESFQTDYATLGGIVEYLEHLSEGLAEASSSYRSCETTVANVVANLEV